MTTEQIIVQRRIRSHGIEVEIGKWENFTKNVENDQTLIIRVKNTKELQIAINAIQSVNEEVEDDDKIIHVRAVNGTWNPNKTLYERASGWLTNIGLNLSPDAYKKSFTTNKSTQLEQGRGAVIIFDENFQAIDDPAKSQPKIVIDEKNKTVTFASGLSLRDVTNELKKKNLMLPCPSMINYVGPGLPENSGHGTGRLQPGFAGTQTEIEYVDDAGNIRTISEGKMIIKYTTGDTDEIELKEGEFETIRAGGLGLFGIRTKTTVSCIERKNVRVRISSYTSFAALREVMQNKLENAEYLTLYVTCPMEEGRPFIQLREWNLTDDPVTPGASAAPFNFNLPHVEQQLEIAAGIPLLKASFGNPEEHKRVLNLISDTEIGLGSGVVEYVTTPEAAFHYQQSYPEDLEDCSMLFARDVKSTGGCVVDILEQIKKIEDKFTSGTQSANGDKQYPFMTIYGRFFKGTNGGLSTSCTEEGQITTAIEVVSIPESPGLSQARDEVIEMMRPYEFKFHHGKYQPEKEDFFKTFKPAAIEKFMKCLDWWRSLSKKHANKHFKEENLKQEERSDKRYVFNNSYFSRKLIEPFRAYLAKQKTNPEPPKERQELSQTA